MSADLARGALRLEGTISVQRLAGPYGNLVFSLGLHFRAEHEHNGANPATTLGSVEPERDDFQKGRSFTENASGRMVFRRSVLAGTGPSLTLSGEGLPADGSLDLSEGYDAAVSATSKRSVASSMPMPQRMSNSASVNEWAHLCAPTIHSRGRHWSRHCGPSMLESATFHFSAMCACPSAFGWLVSIHCELSSPPCGQPVTFAL